MTSFWLDNKLQTTSNWVAWTLYCFFIKKKDHWSKKGSFPEQPHSCVGFSRDITLFKMDQIAMSPIGLTFGLVGEHVFFLLSQDTLKSILHTTAGLNLVCETEHRLQWRRNRFQNSSLFRGSWISQHFDVDLSVHFVMIMINCIHKKKTLQIIVKNKLQVLTYEAGRKLLKPYLSDN